MTGAPRLLAGRYQLKQHMADGGMAEIWLADHVALGIPVAVKLMNFAGEVREDLRKRFEQEARSAAKLKSPHVVSILDYGVDDNKPYIVMELLRGVDLLELVLAYPRWTHAEISALVVQVGKGLATAHDQGIIHRDIKPGNIFLERQSGEVVAKILDFGIAKVSAGEQLTATNTILGSPYYISPEQLRGDTVDVTIDLWALAVVTFRLVTGSLPFAGADAVEITDRILKGKRADIDPALPKAREWEFFFSKALAFYPNDRYADVRSFVDAVVRITGQGSLGTLASRFPEPKVETKEETKTQGASAHAHPAAPRVGRRQVPSVSPDRGASSAARRQAPTTRDPASGARAESPQNAPKAGGSPPRTSSGAQPVGRAERPSSPPATTRTKSPPAAAKADVPAAPVGLGQGAKSSEQTYPGSPPEEPVSTNSIDDWPTAYVLGDDDLKEASLTPAVGHIVGRSSPPFERAANPPAMPVSIPSNPGMSGMRSSPPRPSAPQAASSSQPGFMTGAGAPIAPPPAPPSLRVTTTQLFRSDEGPTSLLSRKVVPDDALETRVLSRRQVDDLPTTPLSHQSVPGLSHPPREPAYSPEDNAWPANEPDWLDRVGKSSKAVIVLVAIAALSLFALLYLVIARG